VNGNINYVIQQLNKHSRLGTHFESSFPIFVSLLSQHCKVASQKLQSESILKYGIKIIGKSMISVENIMTIAMKAQKTLADDRTQLHNAKYTSQS
jgi:hypothetical protein